MTVAEALAAARRTLEAAGVREAALDAELLLRHVLGWDRARLVVDSGKALPVDPGRRYTEAVAARARRVPLQHITGVQAFWRHEFVVTPDVLSPRPETEHLVETALELVRDTVGARIADVGTGTGCIALSLAAERPDARLYAVDLSSAALAVARRNRDLLGVSARLVRGDLVTAFGAGRLDLVVSNPPYVEAADLPGLEPEVRDHEPRLALVPPDGAAGIYARLGRQAYHVLRPGGALAVEVGAGQATMVETAFESAGLRHLRTVADLAGTPRVVVARKSLLD